MVQIAFLTLFLGLTAGKQQVDVAVRGPVSTVELMLDGTAVVRIGSPPWRTRIDFGTALAPHELVARALDAKGQEIGRARQILNLPRPPAEVDILLESGPRGPAGAHLTWRSRDGRTPIARSLLLDGKPVDLNDQSHAVFPGLDPAVSHVLSAEVRFSPTVVARKDVGFGGALGDEVSTELTAVPVRLRRGRKLPETKSLQGWFLAGGKPVPVTAVERGPAQLLIVLDDGARAPLERLDHGRSATSLAVTGEIIRFHMTLDRDDQMRLVWPVARQASGAGLTSELFDASRDYTAKEGGLLWFLERSKPRGDKAAQRLADAVAVAGLQALAGNRPRAVLLVLGYSPKDVSRYDAGAVSRYLESVQVSLAVWSMGDPKLLTETGWTGVEEISTVTKLEAAFTRLRDNLATQRVVWLEGRHLPGAVTLSPAAAEVMELVR